MNIFVRLFFTTFNVDELNNSASMNLIQFLALKLHQGPVFIDWYDGEFNRGRSSLQGKFREGRLKSIVFTETIGAVHQLILQDRYVTYS